MAKSSSTPPNAMQIHRSGTLAETALAHQAPDSRMTLRQGVAEYFRQSGGLMNQSELPPDLGLGLRCHDFAHVVFGCDTTLLREVVLARWSLFGVTGSMRPYLIGLRRRETRGLFRDALTAFRPAMLWHMLKFATVALVRSLRMRERWPFEDYGQYLDQPLWEIRERFGIRVLGAL